MTSMLLRTGSNRRLIRYAVSGCSLGSVLVARSDEGVCAILLGDDVEALTRDLRDRFSGAELLRGESDFEGLIADVTCLIEEPGAGTNLLLDTCGTAFQKKVWEALRAIPAGETLSYGQIAERIGWPGAARAVGAAVGANALAVAIPCHRAVRNDGTMGGYRWGVARKQRLLAREGALGLLLLPDLDVAIAL